MFTDGTKAKEVEEDVKTYDVAELLEKAVIGEPAKLLFLICHLKGSLLHKFRIVEAGSLCYR